MKRRNFIKTTAVMGAVAGLGVMTPKFALAAWNEAAFKAGNEKDAMNALFGGNAEASSAVKLKAPGIAENGAVVPVSVGVEGLDNVESIAIFIEKNPNPLSAEFIIPAGTEADVSTRVRMGKTTMVTAVAKAGGKFYSATQEVKVTIGGCGG